MPEPRSAALTALTATPIVDDPTRATTGPPLRTLTTAEAGRVLAALHAGGHEVVARHNAGNDDA